MKDLVDGARKHWHNSAGLLFSILIALAAGGIAVRAVHPNAAYSAAIFAVAGGIAIVLWLNGRRLPRAKKDKVGIAIAIKADSANQLQVRDDFIRAIRSLIKSGPVANTFQFLEIPEHACELPDDEAALRLARKTRAVILLFGTVRQRPIMKESHEILNLRSFIIHRPMAKEEWTQFAQEIVGLAPEFAQFKTESSIHGFEFTGQWAALAAKYEIAMVACWSDKFDYAETLLMELQAYPTVASMQFPAFQAIRSRIPKHLSRISIIRAQRALEQWSNTRNPDLIDQVGTLIANAKAKGFNENWWLTTECVYEYVTRQRPARVLGLLNRIPKPERDTVWYLNRAFLTACMGNLKGAEAAYRTAERLGVPYNEGADSVLSQIESFLVWRAEQQPTAPEPWYCLAIVNWRLKGDLAQAEHDANRFLNLCGTTKYPRECALVRGSWIPEIRRSQAMSPAGVLEA